MQAHGRLPTDAESSAILHAELHAPGRAAADRAQEALAIQALDVRMGIAPNRSPNGGATWTRATANRELRAREARRAAREAV